MLNSSKDEEKFVHELRLMSCIDVMVTSCTDERMRESVFSLFFSLSFCVGSARRVFGEKKELVMIHIVRQPSRR